MSLEREFNRLAKMDAKAIRKRTAEAWRRMRKQNPTIARMLWRQTRQPLSDICKNHQIEWGGK